MLEYLVEKRLLTLGRVYFMPALLNRLGDQPGCIETRDGFYGQRIGEGQIAGHQFVEEGIGWIIERQIDRNLGVTAWGQEEEAESRERPVPPARIIDHTSVPRRRLGANMEARSYHTSPRSRRFFTHAWRHTCAVVSVPGSLRRPMPSP